MTRPGKAKLSTARSDPAAPGGGELPAPEAFFRSLSALAPIGIFRTDAAGRCVYANARWTEILGFSEEESLGEGWSRAIHPDDREAVLEPRRQARDQGREYSVDCRVLTASAATRWVHVRAAPMFSETGQLTGHLGTIEDVSERKCTEEALRLSDQRYRELAQHAPICIHEIDLEGRLMSMNVAGLRMLGIEAEGDIHGRAFLSLVSADDRERIAGLMAGAFDGRPAWFECTAVINGARRTFASRFVPLTDAGGRVERLMGLSEEITERKRAEEELRISPASSYGGSRRVRVRPGKKNGTAWPGNCTMSSGRS